MTYKVRKDDIEIGFGKNPQTALSHCYDHGFDVITYRGQEIPLRQLEDNATVFTANGSELGQYLPKKKGIRAMTIRLLNYISPFDPE